MIDAERQEIIDAVLSAIRTNSRTISQLSQVGSVSDDDEFELSGGRRITFRNLYECISASLETYETDVDELMQGISTVNLDSLDWSRDYLIRFAQIKGPFLYRVLSYGKLVGVMIQFADSMNHQVTQVLFTNENIDSQGSLTYEHTDGNMYIYRRHLGDKDNTYLSVSATWTPWVSLIPEIPEIPKLPMQVASEEELQRMQLQGLIEQGRIYYIPEEE